MRGRVLHRTVTAFMAIIFYFLIIASATQAAIWESLPVFPRAEKIRQEEVLVNNARAQISVYSSTAELGEIAQFYKDKLANYGWVISSDTTQEGVNALLFTKNNESVNLMLQSVSGRNFITISQSALPSADSLKAGDCPDCQQKEPAAPGAPGEKPSLFPSEDVPGFDLKTVPKYPGALRINSVDRDSGRRASLTYYTQDSIGKVIDYYKTNMSIYNWDLDRDLNLQNVPASVPGSDAASLNAQTLVFKNGSGSCIINIFQDPQNKGTVIGINYNEK